MVSKGRVRDGLHLVSGTAVHAAERPLPHLHQRLLQQLQVGVARRRVVRGERKTIGQTGKGKSTISFWVWQCSNPVFNKVYYLKVEEPGIPFDSDLIKCCPMCNVPIEKDEGCAQMMCKRCKHVFCWYCLASLDVSAPIFVFVLVYLEIALLVFTMGRKFHLEHEKLVL